MGWELAKRPFGGSKFAAMPSAAVQLSAHEEEADHLLQPTPFSSKQLQDRFRPFRIL